MKVPNHYRRSLKIFGINSLTCFSPEVVIKKRAVVKPLFLGPWGPRKEPENLGGAADELPFVWGFKQQRGVVAYSDSSSTFWPLTSLIPHSHTLVLRPCNDGLSDPANL